MKIIKQIRPANMVEKDSLLHILGGATNVNAVSECNCESAPDDNNVNLSAGCICYEK